MDYGQDNSCITVKTLKEMKERLTTISGYIFLAKIELEQTEGSYNDGIEKAEKAIFELITFLRQSYSEEEHA